MIFNCGDPESDGHWDGGTYDPDDRCDGPWCGDRGDGSCHYDDRDTDDRDDHDELGGCYYFGGSYARGVLGISANNYLHVRNENAASNLVLIHVLNVDLTYDH